MVPMLVFIIGALNIEAKTINMNVMHGIHNFKTTEGIFKTENLSVIIVN
jgi:hypothetical protein